jgi:NADH:ubiquinone oxidoreductase subunit 6 (subunit J)
MDAILDVLLRWAHIFPVVVMVGGAVGGRWLGAPVVSALSRNAVFLGAFLIITTGLINMVRMISTVPKGWHMWFGIKFLGALHVLTMIFLMTNPNAPTEKRQRWQMSALIGTAAVVAIAAYMRHLRG